MAPDPSKNSNWFDEFKKLNTGGEAPASRPPSTSAPSAKGSERRQHLRFEVDGAQATVYREGLLSVFGVGKSNQARAAMDLSEGGARFLVHDRIVSGTKVRVVIQMEKYKDAIEATGEVRWCYQSAKKTDDFYIGVQFVDLPAGEVRKIRQMRDWFMSPQYKAVRETKLKQRRKGDDFSFLK